MSSCNVSALTSHRRQSRHEHASEDALDQTRHGRQLGAARPVPRWLAMGPGLARYPALHRPAAVDGFRRILANAVGQQPDAAHRCHGGRGHRGVCAGKPARRLVRLPARHVANRRVRAVALYPRLADRSQGGLRAVVHLVDGLHDLSENPGSHPDRVLSRAGERTDGRPHSGPGSRQPARAFKATRAQIFWKIEFPASLPPLFAGLRIGSTLAVVGVVVGELVGGNQGLGYLLSFGEGQANTPMVFVTILMLTVVGGIAYLAVILVEQRVLHYLPTRATTGF